MSSRSASAWGGAIGMVGVILCWGCVPVMLRHMVHVIDPWTANGLRYPLSALLYWPILWIGIRRGALSVSDLGVCLVPAMFSFGGQIFWAMAPYHLPATKIGFLVRLTIAWSTLGAMLLFQDERRLLRRPDFYVGMTVILIGYGLLSFLQGVFQQPASAQGVGIMLLCSLFFGGYAVSVRKFLQGIPPLYSFGVVAQLVAAGTLIGMGLYGNPRQLLQLNSLDASILVASSILGIAMGHFFLYLAVRNLGATLATAIQTVTPFVTMLIALLFLGEKMTAGELTAGLIMTVGAFLLVRCRSVSLSDPRLIPRQ